MWLNVLPNDLHHSTAEHKIAWQRFFGLYISAATAHYDAVEAEGVVVTESDPGTRRQWGFAEVEEASPPEGWARWLWR